MGLFSKKPRTVEANVDAMAAAAAAGAVAGLRAQQSAQGSPMSESTSAKAPPKKLGRKLLTYGVMGTIALIILSQCVKQGGSIEDAAKQEKIVEKKKEEKVKAYEPQVADPLAAAKSAVKQGEEAAAEEARRNPNAPQPGRDAPLPADLNRVLADTKKLDEAAAVILRGQKGLKTEAGSGTKAKDVSNTDPKNESPVVDADEPPTPGFVGYVPRPKKVEGGIFTPAPIPAQRNSATGTVTDDRIPAESKAARAQALALQNNQGQPQGVQTQREVDSNAEWANNRKSGFATTTVGKIIPTKNTVVAGTVIKLALLNAVDTAMPGKIRAQVIEPVYGRDMSNKPVIGAGSVFLGDYRTFVTDGQDRVMIGFDRLITTSNVEVPVEGITAADALGINGVRGELHTHFWKRMGIATMLAIESSFIERKTGVTSAPVLSGAGSTSGISGAGQIVVNTANQELQRQYAVKPNITIAQGSVMTIVLSNHIQIPVATK